MRTPTRIMLIAVPLTLAGCEGGEETAKTEMPMAAEIMPMGDNMPMAGETGMQTASGEGTVTAKDADAGTITIDHGPVPEVDWPAMTMAFDANEQLRQQVAAGDEVTFDFRMTDAGNEITSITKK